MKQPSSRPATSALLLVSLLAAALFATGAAWPSAGDPAPGRDPNPSNPAAPATRLPIDGTWVIKAILQPSDLTDTILDRALATPGIRGFSERVPWNTVDGTTAPLDAGLAHAAGINSALGFSVRFMAGEFTPASYFSLPSTTAPRYLATPVGGGNLVAVPTPWVMKSGVASPNTAFETLYDAEVGVLAAWCRLHGVKLLHLPWYGLNYAELNNGVEVQGLTGYSYQAWLTGHERLIDIGLKYAGPDLAIEFPLSGYGPIVKAAGDLSTYMATKTGGNNTSMFIQSNGLNEAGDWGSNDPNVEVQMDNAAWVQLLGHGEQMIDAFDYDWNAVFANLHRNDAQYIEIYAFSFQASNAHNADLLANIANFALRLPPPTGVFATPMNAAAIARSTPPPPGNTPITGFLITYYLNGATAGSSFTYLPVQTQVMSNLVNGTPYSYTVATVTANGPGVPSPPSAAFTPSANGRTPAGQGTAPGGSGSRPVAQSLKGGTGVPPRHTPSRTYTVSALMELAQPASVSFAAAKLAANSEWTVADSYLTPVRGPF